MREKSPTVSVTSNLLPPMDIMNNYTKRRIPDRQRGREKRDEKEKIRED